MLATTTLWYVTRGSGVVALVLLTVSVGLGVLTSLRVHLARWPRFAVTSMHRNLTLLTVVFVAVHVVTTVTDSFAPIHLQDAVVPFLSPYRPIWLGLGTVAFDVLLALVVTSYLRHRIGVRMWRGVHWLAYVCWPVALVHALGTGSDARSGFLVAVSIASLALVALAVLARLAAASGRPRVRLASVVATLAVPIAIVGWSQIGPAKHGWARRAGTPAGLLRGRRARVSAGLVATSGTVSPPRSFRSYATGAVRQGQSANGDERVSVRLRLAGSPHGALRLELRGTPSGSGVSMSQSGVSFVPATTRAVYLGSVTGLQGNDVLATVADAAGDRLLLELQLTLDQGSGKASAIVYGSTPEGENAG